MKPAPPKPPHAWKSIFGVAAFGLVLCCLPVLAYFTWDHPWIAMVLAFFYIVTAFVLQSRLIICTLVGLALGLLLIDTHTVNRSEDYRVWQPVWSLGTGLAIGLVVGFVWDRAEALGEKSDRREPRKRRD